VHLTGFEALMAALGAIVTALMAIALGLRWIYRQGVSSQKLVDSIDKNTDATGKLSAAYEHFSEETGRELLDHEKRITRLEDRWPGRAAAQEGR